MMMKTTLTNGVAALALATGLGAASQAAAQELQYWVYSDFAQGDALALQQEFIAEFVKDHPGVSITITGKGDDDLTAGQVAGAASGTLPDIFMNATSVGAQLVSVGALANIHDQWMAMPQEYRDQFDAEAIATCQPKPDEMYCIPYTGFGSLLFRNLTVLEKAGIDTSKAPANWDEWFAQMQKIKEAGFYAMPDEFAGLQLDRGDLCDERQPCGMGHRLGHQDDADHPCRHDGDATEIHRHQALGLGHQPQ